MPVVISFVPENHCYGMHAKLYMYPTKVAFGLFCDNIFVSVEYQLKIDEISKVEIKSLPTNDSVCHHSPICSHGGLIL